LLDISEMVGIDCLTDISTQITEMLLLFSTSPDKSMSLDDFTRMMVMAKLAW